MAGDITIIGGRLASVPVRMSAAYVATYRRSPLIDTFRRSHDRARLAGLGSGHATPDGGSGVFLMPSAVTFLRSPSDASHRPRSNAYLVHPSLVSDGASGPLGTFAWSETRAAVRPPRWSPPSVGRSSQTSALTGMERLAGLSERYPQDRHGTDQDLRRGL